MTKEALQQIELDRTNDAVYSATTGVARVVIDMIRGVQQAQADRYVELVKVGGYLFNPFKPSGANWLRFKVFRPTLV